MKQKPRKCKICKKVFVPKVPYIAYTCSKECSLKWKAKLQMDRIIEKKIFNSNSIIKKHFEFIKTHDVKSAERLLKELQNPGGIV